MPPRPFFRDSQPAQEQAGDDKKATFLALQDRISALETQLARAESAIRLAKGRISNLEDRQSENEQMGGASGPVVEIVPMGNLANRMIQLMVAQSIADKVPGCRIEGALLPEWGVAEPHGARPGERAMTVEGQWVAVERLARMLCDKQVDRIILKNYGQHFENFLPVERYRGFFRADPMIAGGFGPAELVINIRGGEVLQAPHPAYVLLPIDFYAEIIERTGLKPVFLGQLTPSPYMDDLRARFPRATYVESRGPIADFETVRRSKNILPAVSTFSWLAAWLSEASQIILPLSGLFNPMQCPDVDLIPRQDSRYSFFLFPINLAVDVGQYRAAHTALAGRWRAVEADAVFAARARRPSEPRSVDEYLQVFDPDFYVKRYYDVADVLASGYMADAQTHYRLAGFSENREILALDEGHYSRVCPDAAIAVAEGRYLDFLHHFVREGRAGGITCMPIAAG